MKIHAKCRYCGDKVSYFGEICRACEAAAEGADLLMQLNRECDAIITERMDNS